LQDGGKSAHSRTAKC